MALIGLISNPTSTGNRRLLPEIRAFAQQHGEIFHVEVESVEQIPEALAMIVHAAPRVLVINGGDGTIQATLTEMYHSQPFGKSQPPIAVLPSGKTNLIARDLGGTGDPITSLRRILELARSDLTAHVVQRNLISVSNGQTNRPVMGMFMGGAGLAQAILFCRHMLYPLGLSNAFAHGLALMVMFLGTVVGGASRLAPISAEPMRLRLQRGGTVEGNFSVFLATSLDRLLLGSELSADLYKSASMPAANGLPGEGNAVQPAGAVKLLCLEQRRRPVIQAFWATLMGRIGRSRIAGLHLHASDEVHIEGRRPRLIVDGELVESLDGSPLVLRSTPAQNFLSLAAAA